MRSLHRLPWRFHGGRDEDGKRFRHANVATCRAKVHIAGFAATLERKHSVFKQPAAAAYRRRAVSSRQRLSHQDAIGTATNQPVVKDRNRLVFEFHADQIRLHGVLPGKLRVSMSARFKCRTVRGVSSTRARSRKTRPFCEWAANVSAPHRPSERGVSSTPGGICLLRQRVPPFRIAVAELADRFLYRLGREIVLLRQRFAKCRDVERFGDARRLDGAIASDDEPPTRESLHHSRRAPSRLAFPDAAVAHARTRTRSRSASSAAVPTFASHSSPHKAHGNHRPIGRDRDHR